MGLLEGAARGSVGADHALYRPAVALREQPGGCPPRSAVGGAPRQCLIQIDRNFPQDEPPPCSVTSSNIETPAPRWQPRREPLTHEDNMSTETALAPCVATRLLSESHGSRASHVLDL